MSKAFIPTKEVKYPYPLRFGSHKSMQVDDNPITCKDEFGIYHTTIDRLDNGLADPNRYAESRLTKLIGN